MVAKTWYVTNNLAGTAHQEMSESSPGAEATASPQTGWVVGTGATLHAKFDAQSSPSTFSGTTVPASPLVTTAGAGDCWRTTNAYTGTFASANWNVHFAARGVTQAGTQDGRIRVRLYRGANADGSSATEITSAHQQGGLITNLLTSATQTSTATFNPGSFSVSNEYIFVQLAWERTGAGGMSTTDVAMRIGVTTGSRVISSDFSETISGAGDADGVGTATGVGQDPHTRAVAAARGGEGSGVVSLLHFDGPDNSQAFFESGPRKHTWTPFNSEPVIDTAQSKFG
ncbi:MAG TPA: hypothetical protein VK575_00390, partial [Gemmatimonadaceae bacterium]|nr:hypothetical protein [Gemmatimonadaceae bacterium]